MKDIVNFIFELENMQRIKHEGWRLAGVNNPESIADHSLNAAQIGFILAKLEGEDPYKVCSMLVFHDIAEVRTGDIHKVANRYVKNDEERALKDQLNKLDFGEEILDLWKQVEYKETKAGIVAKDADLLEMAFKAKQYIEQGHSSAIDWINNIKENIKTDSAKKILKQLKETNSTDWWKGLKKIN